jgi:hypothetical protein
MGATFLRNLMTINQEIDFKYVGTICGTSSNDVISTPINPFSTSSLAYNHYQE